MDNKTEVAKAIVQALPESSSDILSFNVTFVSSGGTHQAEGFVYNKKLHGFIHVQILFGYSFDVKIANGVYSVL